MFELDKKNILSRIDKSRKGSIDTGILKLVEKMNKSSDYYTTSSCSGRIMLISVGKRKNECRWIYSTHDKAAAKDVISALKKSVANGDMKDDIWFKCEPAILHVACRTIDDAQKLVDIARNSGFKRTGIQSTRKKIIVEVNSSDIIETPVAEKGRIIAEDSYIKRIVEAANRKQKTNRNKIKKLESSF